MKVKEILKLIESDIELYKKIDIENASDYYRGYLSGCVNALESVLERL